LVLAQVPFVLFFFQRVLCPFLQHGVVEPSRLDSPMK
jgi:hypothetical protein